MVGASGAIGGVMGAYILLYPRVHVHMLIFLGFFITTVAVPAVVMLGYGSCSNSSADSGRSAIKAVVWLSGPTLAGSWPAKSWSWSFAIRACWRGTVSRVDAAPLAVAELAPDRAIDAAVSRISDGSHCGQACWSSCGRVPVACGYSSPKS